MSRKYARGSRARGECERSGKDMLLKDMVYDGHVPGLRVAPEWWEPRHPQEYLPPVDDPVALRDPAPDRNRVPYTLRWPLIDDQFRPIYTPQVYAGLGTLGGSSSIGQDTGVEVETEIGTVSFLVAFEPAGVETATEIGTVSFLVTFETDGVETLVAVGEQEGTSADQPESGNEADSEIGTSDIAATTEPATVETASETGQLGASSGAATGSVETTSAVGFVTLIVEEDGYGTDTFGSGSWGQTSDTRVIDTSP